jgi:hypothetical protein
MRYSEIFGWTIIKDAATDAADTWPWMIDESGLTAEQKAKLKAHFAVTIPLKGRPARGAARRG